MHSDLGELFDQINLHEMAHTWFGDLVVCKDYANVAKGELGNLYGDRVASTQA